MSRVAELAVMFLASCGGVLRGQSTKASVSSSVTDPSEAIIAEATVAAINSGANICHQGVTNDVGEYYLTNLPPGSYRIEIERTGFKKLIKPDVILRIEDGYGPAFRLWPEERCGVRARPRRQKDGGAFRIPAVSDFFGLWCYRPRERNLKWEWVMMGERGIAPRGSAPAIGKRSGT